MSEWAWLFPVLFMLHEMEEIIGFEKWLVKNDDLLEKYRFMKYVSRGFTTQKFALAVLYQYLLCILLTIFSIYFDNYWLWIGVFGAFAVHLVGHIVQSYIVKRYIPSLYTSILLLPVCIYLIEKSSEKLGYRWVDLALSVGISVVLMIANLIFIHWLMIKNK